MQHGVNPDFPDGQPSSFNGWRVFLAAVIFAIVWGTVVAMAGGVVYALPREYYSRVIVEVGPGRALCDWNPAPTPVPSVPLAPIFHAIQSKAVLYQVVENLRLVENWGMEGDAARQQAYNRLLEMLKLNTGSGTNLVEIGVFSPDRVEAANIANTIAVVFQKSQREEPLKAYHTALAQSREEVQSLRKKTDALLIEMQKIRESEQIPGSAERSVVSTDETPLEQGVIGLGVSIAELKAKRSQIAALKPAEFLTALPALDLQDPTIAKVLPLLREAASEEARLLSDGLGEDAPRIKALRAQKDAFTRQVSDALAGVDNHLAVKLVSAETKRNEAAARLAEMNPAGGSSPRAQDYVRVKSEYIKAKCDLGEAEQRLASQTVELRMNVSPVKIWEKAEPAIYPAKPDVRRILGLGAGGGMVLGLLAAGLFLGFARRG